MSKSIKATLLLAMLFGLVVAGSAWADHGHHFRGRAHFGVFIGPPWPWYYPPAYYYPYPYYPPVVTAPASPPVYIEQGEARAAAPQQAQQYWWYYCNDAKGYYPYIKECPGGWQKVAPQPSQP